MNIDFITVGYVFLCLVFVPMIILTPQLIIYLLIIITMFPFFFGSPIHLGPVNVYSQDLILLLYCCIISSVVFFRYITKNKKILDISDEEKPFIIIVVIYILMHVVFIFAGLYQKIPPDSVVRRFLIYSGCLYFFFPLFFIRDKDQIRKLLVFIIIVSALYPIFQIFSFAREAQWEREITSSGTIRLGAGGLPILACALFTILIFKKEIKYYVLTISPILAIVIAGHRSALIALGLSILLIFMLIRQLSKSLLFIYLSSFSLILALLAIELFTGYSFISDTKTRSMDTFSTENETTVGRIDSIKDNFLVFTKRPITGIGYKYELLPGYFNTNKLIGGRPSIREVKKDVDKVLAPHNFVMRFLSHTGIIGTSLILTIIGMLLMRCKSFLHLNDNLRHSSILTISTVIFFIVMSLMNTTFVTEGWFFWFLCGLNVQFKKLITEDVPSADNMLLGYPE